MRKAASKNGTAFLVLGIVKKLTEDLRDLFQYN